MQKFKGAAFIQQNVNVFCHTSFDIPRTLTHLPRIVDQLQLDRTTPHSTGHKPVHLTVQETWFKWLELGCYSYLITIVYDNNKNVVKIASKGIGSPKYCFLICVREKMK